MPRKKFRFFRMPPVYWTLILAALIALFAAGWISQNQYLADNSAEVAALTAERDSLQEEVLSLQRKIDFSKTDEFIEREARRTRNLIMPGETLFLPAE